MKMEILPPKNFKGRGILELGTDPCNGEIDVRFFVCCQIRENFRLSLHEKIADEAAKSTENGRVGFN